MNKFILTSCLFLNGCFYQSVSQWDIERATKTCKGVNNIVEISASFEGTERTTCRDYNNSTII